MNNEAEKVIKDEKNLEVVFERDPIAFLNFKALPDIEDLISSQGGRGATNSPRAPKSEPSAFAPQLISAGALATPSSSLVAIWGTWRPRSEETLQLDQGTDAKDIDRVPTPRNQVSDSNQDVGVTKTFQDENVQVHPSVYKNIQIPEPDSKLKKIRDEKLDNKNSKCPESKSQVASKSKGFRVGNVDKKSSKAPESKHEVVSKSTKISNGLQPNTQVALKKYQQNIDKNISKRPDPKSEVFLKSKGFRVGNVDKKVIKAPESKSEVASKSKNIQGGNVDKKTLKAREPISKVASSIKLQANIDKILISEMHEPKSDANVDRNIPEFSETKSGVPSRSISEQNETYTRCKNMFSQCQYPPARSQFYKSWANYRTCPNKYVKSSTPTVFIKSKLARTEATEVLKEPEPIPISSSRNLIRGHPNYLRMTIDQIPSKPVNGRELHSDDWEPVTDPRILRDRMKYYQTFVDKYPHLVKLTLDDFKFNPTTVEYHMTKAEEWDALVRASQTNVSKKPAVPRINQEGSNTKTGLFKKPSGSLQGLTIASNFQEVTPPPGVETQTTYQRPRGVEVSAFRPRNLSQNPSVELSNSSTRDVNPWMNLWGRRNSNDNYKWQEQGSRNRQARAFDVIRSFEVARNKVMREMASERQRKLANPIVNTDMTRKQLLHLALGLRSDF